MSHHGFKLNFAVDHELLTIFIETLTGSTFEMVVTPIDSIASIKAKIQRMEGVLVSQQHLLYNLQELDDQSTVQDYGIQDGSTIKLVLSMTGGPLGTARRILPLDDVVVREFVELEKNEIEDLPPGSKLAIIVFRDDDSVNMFRVLENTDGSFSPLSSTTLNSSIMGIADQTSGTSTNTVKSESDKDNMKTRNKMEDLKNKMEALTLQKKSENMKKKAIVETSIPHLPPIKSTHLSDTVKSHEKKTEDTSKECAMSLSQVPVLPHITSQYHMKQRPHSSPPSKLTGEQICQILSDAGKHRTQLLSSHCTTSTINRLSQSSSMEYDSTSWSRGSASGSGGKQGSLALYSPGPSRSLLNPLLSENNTSILAAKKLPVNEYKVVKPATSSMYKLSPITSTSSKPQVSRLSGGAGSDVVQPSTSEPYSKSGVGKKKPSMKSRCSECNKKLNISATYTCRCQKLFCSRHRYSEAHACTYDYKKEGRKLIAEANPQVTAPKLTKF